ncbi:hypothetical protein AAHA92_28283 [Salvia divinorum]|uniref:Pectinesterase inhibitor domain-containing protein n=1 Tax=Salvia divinorum TaxID=28513 RepID=A0ABD1FUK8_SALDI
MAKMVQSALLATLALLLVSAAYADLEEACKKTTDPAYCKTLLEPSAAEFADNNPAKMQAASTKAAVEKIVAVRTLLSGPLASGARDNKTREAIRLCLVDVNNSPLSTSKRRGSNTAISPQAERSEAISTAAMAAEEMVKCQNTLKRNEKDAKAAGGDSAEITTQGIKAAAEAELACNIAKGLIA